MSLHSQQKQIQHRVQTLLTKHFDTLDNHAPRLKQAMEYALLSGGKRMRPFLAYATGEMLGVAQSNIDPIAMALECVHSYSLVHDDLPAMDDDNLRRGKPTCHVAFDEATAILAGDALQTLAFEILSDAGYGDITGDARARLMSLLAGASGYQGMCGGQAMDLAATNCAVDQTQLELLHRKKTGALLQVAVQMACSLAENIQQPTHQALTQFADCIGLAFQVQDDILDVTGDSKTLGKPQGSDEALNKSTYPALLGLDEARAYLHQLHQQALQALRGLPYNTEVLAAFADYNLQRDH